MRHTESKIQQSCVRWFRLQYSGIGNLLFAIPNGGYRSPIEAGIMQGEGVTPGVADMMLAVPNDRKHGLFVEFKAGKGKQTTNQLLFQSRVMLQGYDYEVVTSLDEFMKTVNAYLNN